MDVNHSFTTRTQISLQFVQQLTNVGVKCFICPKLPVELNAVVPPPCCPWGVMGLYYRSPFSITQADVLHYCKRVYVDFISCPVRSVRPSVHQVLFVKSCWFSSWMRFAQSLFWLIGFSWNIGHKFALHLATRGVRNARATREQQTYSQSPSEHLPTCMYQFWVNKLQILPENPTSIEFNLVLTTFVILFGGRQGGFTILKSTFSNVKARLQKKPKKLTPWPIWAHRILILLALVWLLSKLYICLCITVGPPCCCRPVGQKRARRPLGWQDTRQHKSPERDNGADLLMPVSSSARQAKMPAWLPVAHSLLFSVVTCLLSGLFNHNGSHIFISHPWVPGFELGALQ